MLVAVIAEAPIDATVCTELCNRVIHECDATPDWIRDDPEQLQHEFEYAGLEPETDFTPRRKIKALAERQGVEHKRPIQRLRRFGTPITEDFADTWRAVALVAFSDRKFNAVILSRDSDGKTERIQSWAEVSEKFRDSPIAIVIAGAHCKLEAWILNGFRAKNPDEERRLAAERAKLGFDPVTNAEKLSATTKGAKRDAKRVVKNLTGDEYDRKQECWMETALGILRANGVNTGLCGYLCEVEEILIPLLRKK